MGYPSNTFIYHSSARDAIKTLRISGGEGTVPAVGAQSFPQKLYEIEVDFHQDITKDMRSKLLIKVEEEMG